MRKGTKTCECGCGTEIPALRADFQPARFVSGHQARVQHRKKPGDTLRHSAGYVLEYAPDHPKAHHGYVYQHVLRWEERHGSLPHGWVIHHRNGIKDDNRVVNLEATLPSAHMRHHLAERTPEQIRQNHRRSVEARRKNGNARLHFERICAWCGAPFFSRTVRQYTCSKSCGQKARHGLKSTPTG